MLAQVTQIQRRTSAKQLDDVEIMTVDKCQGRDKAVILMSLVRSNQDQQAGSLLADWRRINVALTRAQRKLVMVGSAQTVSSVPLLRQLVQLCRDKAWVLDASRES